MTMASNIGATTTESQPQLLQRLNHYSRRYQQLLDSTTPLTVQRWIAFGVSLFIYFIRVFTIQGWYIVTYALGIYLLNLFLAFLSPKFDPALEQLDADEDKEGPQLPTSKDDEFRPFIRRLPEFKFWYSAIRAVLVAFFCTFFDAFDVPVFWPILLIYFIILFSVTMKRQIKHMIKYKYIPFDFRKKRFSSSAGMATKMSK